MNILVTGGGGQLATTLVREVSPNVSVTVLSRSELDVSDSNLTMARISALKPDAIINTAAYTAVDLAESDPEAANAVNSVGVRHLAQAADKVSARLIHISTDFVFDGRASKPYRPDDPKAPQSKYGRSKLDGERAVREILGDSAVIVRTSWLYSLYGSNFVTTMLDMMRSRESISVVHDQSGSPTWAASLAKVVYRFADTPELGGTWHWSDAGVATWYEFAVGIQEASFDAGLLKKRISINPCTTDEFGALAPRPCFSALDFAATEQALGITATHWSDNLREMMRDKKPT